MKNISIAKTGQIKMICRNCIKFRHDEKKYIKHEKDGICSFKLDLCDDSNRVNHDDKACCEFEPNKRKAVNVLSEIESLKQENERLKAEVDRLSDPFLHAPDYMEWFAVDKTGDATWWNEEPFPVDNSYWEPNARIFYLAQAGYYPELAAYWKNSKVKRVRKSN